LLRTALDGQDRGFERFANAQIFAASAGVMKNDTERVPSSAEQLTYPMTHGHPIIAARASDRTMMDGENDSVPLVQWDNGCF
jgi:hypothetical protein